MSAAGFLIIPDNAEALEAIINAHKLEYGRSEHLYSVDVLTLISEISQIMDYIALHGDIDESVPFNIKEIYGAAPELFKKYAVSKSDVLDGDTLDMLFGLGIAHSIKNPLYLVNSPPESIMGELRKIGASFYYPLDESTLGLLEELYRMAGDKKHRFSVIGKLLAEPDV